MPLTEDILLKETFTDKDLFNLPTAPNNPLWHRYGEDSDIRTTPDYTNRYLSLYYTEDQYYTAGDQQWTDYSVSMDVTFPEDSSENESNTFKLLLRHQNIASLRLQRLRGHLHHGRHRGSALWQNPAGHPVSGAQQHCQHLPHGGCRKSA